MVLGVLRARAVLGLELELAPLTAASVRQLARQTGTLADTEVEQVVTLAEGSPLLAVETARAFRDGDPAAGLRGAVRAALDRLEPPARLFVELVAVAGRELSTAEVSALPLLPDPARAATGALGADLLRSRVAGIGFRHQLLRDAVYDNLPVPQLMRLHHAIGEMLRQRASHTGTRGAAEIAAHLRSAGRDELALAHLIRAASHARDVAALPEATRFLREASQISPDDAELLVELAEVQAWRGLLIASDTAFDQALERIAPQDSGALIGAWLRRGRWLRGGVCHPRESRRSYRAALDVLDRDPTAEPFARAEALAGMAWAEAVAGDPGAVDQLLREAAEITAKHPAGDLLVHDVGVARGHALLRAGQFTHSYGPLIAASAAAGRAGRPDMAYSCLINAASAAACAGDFDRALDFADRCVGLVGPNGLLRLGVYTQSARAAILRRLARHEQAHSACDRAGELAEKIGLSELEGLVHHDRGLLALTEGAPANAATELRLALELNAPVSRPLTRLYRAEALVRAGQPDAAETELRAVAVEPVSAGDFPDTLVARMSYVQGLIALARDDHGLAEKRLLEARAGWRRRCAGGGTTGESYVAALVDLGRPPLSMFIEPDEELARVSAELATLTD
jgi:tetratricopeptide (TPR) repeat protein